MTKIGSQDGITAFHNMERDAHPDKTLLTKGKDGKWPDMNQALAGVPIDQWKAIDKHQRTEQLLVDDHDDDDYRPPPPGVDLAPAQARIFLAQSPLDAMAAPAWMVPVCTADPGYRYWYDDYTISMLRTYFGTVETWCDCRGSGGTPYQTALDMCAELDLDGAWGQCETEPEFDHAYQGGARRMIGQLAGLRPDQADRIGTTEVLLAFELYRNVMPWQVPDYGNDGAGVGGNAIGCYASETEGAVYTSVAAYKQQGYYQPHRDSVYGVGLTSQDWADLA